MNILRSHADTVVREAIKAVLPEPAVRRALEGREFPDRVRLVAAGKAAWRMADAAADCLGESVESGIVITKYGHVKGNIPRVECFEAGHPVPDGNSFRAARAALGLVKGLGAEDTVLFLLSGGGSALFELPLIPAEELEDITGQLLRSGADIVELNTVRKRLSAVKGGRFALACMPAKVETIALSDVLGNREDMIASGPTCPDPSTSGEALSIAEKYGLRLSEKAWKLLGVETPKRLYNARMTVTGSVVELCAAAARACSGLGYEPSILTSELRCEAREAGKNLASIVASHAGGGKRLAFIAGGETVVRVTGHGLGGRNQELALSAAMGIDGLENAAVFSVGSDGTDGPTDAAGGFVDGSTCSLLAEMGIDVDSALRENDSYNALSACGGLIITGPTGTNVNDVSVGLVMG